MKTIAPALNSRRGIPSTVAYFGWRVQQTNRHRTKPLGRRSQLHQNWEKSP